MEELRSRGFPLVVTARDAFQVCELADKKGIPYVKVGRHYGKSRLRKILGLSYRAWQLRKIISREAPALGISHGARSQLLLGSFLRIPTLLLEDYEYCQFPPLMRPTWIMAPEVIPAKALPVRESFVLKYPGIKEDVYAWKLRPDVTFLRELGIEKSDILITVRPPATEAHYHNPESEVLFESFMNRAVQTRGVKIVLLPRNGAQAAQIKEAHPEWFRNETTVIPARALDGLNLIWHSDLVVSGGGTMNREAAALGVPVYSIFRGTIGAVDQFLHKEGRLVMVEDLRDVELIRIQKREARSIEEITSRKTLLAIVDTIERIAESLVPSV
jgi:predicted glycosyltransferase